MFTEKNAKEFQDSKVTALEYYALKKIFISGFSVKLNQKFFKKVF